MEEGEQAASAAAMAEVEIPPYFTCPISLQIMRDPVTLPTGITYDRESIENWLFTSNKDTCPVTKQPLQDPPQLTPNSTLRRLIQSWCSAHSILRLPTPRSPPDPSLLLRDAYRHPPSLRTLLDHVSDSDRYRKSAERAGAASAMLRILEDPSSALSAREDALSVLHSLRPSEETLRELVSSCPEIINLLTRELGESTRPGRANAVSVLHSVVRVAGAAGLGEDVFGALVTVLRDRVSYRATKAALRLLKEALPVGRNRVRAAEAGAVEVLVEVLLEGPENRVVEMVLMVMEMLCGCAEGREALAGHAAGVAVVARIVMTVSELASERAVKVLWWVGKHATGRLVEEMVQVGAVMKLCYCAQAEGVGEKMKYKAREVLAMHARAWRGSPCVPRRLPGIWP